jgi:hypothetical protein
LPFETAVPCYPQRTLKKSSGFFEASSMIDPECAASFLHKYHNIRAPVSEANRNETAIFTAASEFKPTEQQ